MAKQKGLALRERQAERVRHELRAQFIRLVVEKGGLGFSLHQVAAAAGVSDRTLYRYYPNREALVEAITEEEVDALELELRARAGHLRSFDHNPDLIADTFEVFEEHADLVKATRMLRTAGVERRASSAQTRGVKQLLGEHEPLHPSVVGQLTALIRLLTGSDSWARMRESDIDLDPREAGYAAHWAVHVLLRAAEGVEGPLRPQASHGEDRA